MEIMEKHYMGHFWDSLSLVLTVALRHTRAVGPINHKSVYTTIMCAGRYSQQRGGSSRAGLLRESM